MSEREDENERTCAVMRKIAKAYMLLGVADKQATEWGWDTSEIYEAREKIADYMASTFVGEEEVEDK